MIYDAVKYGIFRCELSGIRDAKPVIEGGFRVEVAKDSAAFEKLAGESDLGWCSFASKISEGLGNGAMIFLVFSGPDIVHVSWVSPEKEASVVDPVFGKLCIENGVYIGPCLTRASYRGMGCYTLALKSICGYRFSNEKTAAYICTKISNGASVKGMEKAGFRKVGEFSYRRFMRWGFYDIPSVGVGA